MVMGNAVEAVKRLAWKAAPGGRASGAEKTSDDCVLGGNA